MWEAALRFITSRYPGPGRKDLTITLKRLDYVQDVRPLWEVPLGQRVRDLLNFDVPRSGEGLPEDVFGELNLQSDRAIQTTRVGAGPVHPAFYGGPGSGAGFGAGGVGGSRA